MIDLPPAYPLTWPDGWERTDPYRRVHSRYRVTVARAVDLLATELHSWKSVSTSYVGNYIARRYVISTNVSPRSDGRAPSSSGRLKNNDPGVAVWWAVSGAWNKETCEFDETLRVVACDTWRTVQENVRACGVVIASLRAIDRAKASEMLRRADFNLKAGLPVIVPPVTDDQVVPSPQPEPSPRRRTGAAWYELRLDLPYPFTTEDVMRAYRARVREEHPDRGGDHEEFLSLEHAKNAALKACVS